MLGYFHYKDKTMVRPSYLYNGNPYVGNIVSVYWYDPGAVFKWTHFSILVHQKLYTVKDKMLLPEHAANLVAHRGNIVYGVAGIERRGTNFNFIKH